MYLTDEDQLSGFKISTLQKEEESNEFTELLSRVQAFLTSKSVYKYKELRSCTINLPENIDQSQNHEKLESDKKLNQVVGLIDDHIV